MSSNHGDSPPRPQSSGKGWGRGQPGLETLGKFGDGESIYKSRTNPYHPRKSPKFGDKDGDIFEQSIGDKLGTRLSSIFGDKFGESLEFPKIS